MKDTDKITMTVEQLKKLVKESRQVGEAKEVDPQKAWEKANRALNPTKREIANKAKTLYNQLKDKFIATLTKDFVRNNISFHSDRPQDAAEQVFDALMDGETISTIVKEMYLFDDGNDWD